MSRLVGWTAQRDGVGVLTTSRAYDLAYHTLYQSLPDCRNRCLCSFF
jgi:hypothetical protein